MKCEYKGITYQTKPRDGEDAKEAFLRVLTSNDTITISTVDGAHLSGQINLPVTGCVTMGGHYGIELQDENDDDGRERFQRILEATGITNGESVKLIEAGRGGVWRVLCLEKDDIIRFVNALAA